MSKQQRKAKKQKARAKAARVKAWRAYRAKSCGGRIFQQVIPALYECVPAEAVVFSGLDIFKDSKEQARTLLETRLSDAEELLANQIRLELTFKESNEY